MKPNPSIFICAKEICRKTFASLNSLKKHAAVYHVDDADSETKNSEDISVKNFKCDYDGCRKEFRFQKQLYDHKYNSHKTGKIYGCNSCSLSFPTPSKLKRHTKQHTGYPCSVTGCLILSKTVHDRQKHVTECHPVKKEGVNFICEKCSNKTFADEKRLIRHQKLHPNLVKCPEIGCSAEFFRKFLKKHMKECHFDKIPPDGRQNGVAVLPYVCNECPKTFAKSEHLKKHIQRSHLDNNDRPRSNKFICPSESCGRSFVSQIKWESHVNWHNNEKPFKCPINDCSNCFSGKLSLQRHLRQIHLTTLQRISAIDELICAADATETATSQSSSEMDSGIILN